MTVERIIAEHKEWVITKGACGSMADFTGMDLMGKDLSGLTLDKVSFRRADCRGVKFDGSSLIGAKFEDSKCNEASFEDADLSEANLSDAVFDNSYCSKAKFAQVYAPRAIFNNSSISDAEFAHAFLARTYFINAYAYGADFTRANLTDATLCEAHFVHSNFDCALLKGADLTGTFLDGSHMTGAILSGCRGLSKEVPLEKCEGGWIAYKVVGRTSYTAPNHWDFRPGNVLEEEVNTCRSNTCGSGVNVATRNWVVNDTDGLGYTGSVWKVLIRWEWAHMLVVPYDNTGKLRCGKCELLEVVGSVDYGKFRSL